jgi:hypothetical protein
MFKFEIARVRIVINVVALFAIAASFAAIVAAPPWLPAETIPLLAAACALRAQGGARGNAHGRGRSRAGG